MRYVKARFEFQNREMAYRIYVTDALRVICGANGVERYADVALPKQAEDPRTSGEVVENIRQKLRRLA